MLTPQELFEIIPSLATLTCLEAEGLILRAQSLAESCYGANRVLDIKEYEETKELLSRTTINLNNFPLIEVLSLEIKNNTIISFDGAGGGLPTSTGWELISPEEYTVNFSKAKVEISLSYVPKFAYGSAGVFGIRNRPMQRRAVPEVKVVYKAGFDFYTNHSSLEIRKMKTALAGIAEVMYREQKGVKSEKSSGSEITYFQNFSSLNPYINFLSIFHKYRARNSFT